MCHLNWCVYHANKARDQRSGRPAKTQAASAATRDMSHINRFRTNWKRSSRAAFTKQKMGPVASGLLPRIQGHSEIPSPLKMLCIQIWRISDRGLWKGPAVLGSLPFERHTWRAARGVPSVCHSKTCSLEDTKSASRANRHVSTQRRWEQQGSSSTVFHWFCSPAGGMSSSLSLLFGAFSSKMNTLVPSRGHTVNGVRFGENNRLPSHPRSKHLHTCWATSP